MVELILLFYQHRNGLFPQILLINFIVLEILVIFELSGQLLYLFRAHSADCLDARFYDLVLSLEWEHAECAIISFGHNLGQFLLGEPHINFNLRFDACIFVFDD